MKEKQNLEDGPDSLTDEQKILIVNRCKAAGEPPSLKDLCELAFGPGTDGRGKRARLIKEFCGKEGHKFRVSYKYYPVSQDITFNDEQQQFIKAHVGEMTVVEIARVLYADMSINNLSIQSRAVKRFIDTLKGTDILPDTPDNDIPLEKYNPPKTATEACNRINLYIKDGIKREALEKDTRVQKNLKCLVKYMHNPRFTTLMNSFSSNADRILFESSFIRYLYQGGEDVSEIDIDAFISLCLEVVNRTNLQRELEKLNRMRDDSLNDSEGKRLSMSIVEMIGKVHQAIDNTEKRQNQLRQSLEGNRSKRMELKLQESHSVLQLVEAWREEEKRKWMLRIAEARKKLVNKEIENLDNMDAIKVEIFGLDREAF